MAGIPYTSKAHGFPPFPAPGFAAFGAGLGTGALRLAAMVAGGSLKVGVAKTSTVQNTFQICRRASSTRRRASAYTSGFTSFDRIICARVAA